MSLAIVIPAYKDKYLYKTLLAFENQTKKDFTIYIGDDNSPYDLKRICEQFVDKLNIIYTRFDDNIGAKNLVNQWTRCIELTKDEKWIWLFSDDDLIDKNCVENFLKLVSTNSLVKKTVDIYRFNTIVIDENDKILWVPLHGPNYESSEQMAYNLLLDKRGNSLADHIFTREVYNKSGGLVFTEYAQGADWAMSILFSKEKGIAIIPGSNFYWRFSGSNISSSTGQVKTQMLKGHLQFITWLVSHFKYLRSEHNDITYNMIIMAAKRNLKYVIMFHYKGFNIQSMYHIVSVMRLELLMSYKEIISNFYTIIKTTNPTMQFLSRIKRSYLKTKAHST